MIDITYIKEGNLYPKYNDSIDSSEYDSDSSIDYISDDNCDVDNWECNNTLPIYETSTYLGLEDFSISQDALINLYFINKIN